MIDGTETLQRRLDEAEVRLTSLASAGFAGMTKPDDETGEQWEAGQVWAHVADFVTFQLGQARKVLASTSDELPVFGRIRTDPGRVGSIEANRHRTAIELLGQAREAIADVRGWMNGLTPAEWSVEGRHVRLGQFTIRGIVEKFLVEHLEEHATQLDALRAR